MQNVTGCQTGKHEGETMTEQPGSERVRTEMTALIPALRSFARRLDRSPTNVDDLVQETLLRALANIDKFQEGTSLKSWMFTILRNTFCTKFGLAKRETVGLEDCASARPTVNAPQEWCGLTNSTGPFWICRTITGMPSTSSCYRASPMRRRPHNAVARSERSRVASTAPGRNWRIS
jgi:RNA polymerase sigma factor (sigma-70 family)